jgi:hypothetical protein
MSGLPIFVRNIEACRTLGRPIYTGYSPLNKESSLENQHPAFSFPTEFFISLKVTSSSPQVCESIAYGGISFPVNSTGLRVFVLMKRMMGQRMKIDFEDESRLQLLLVHFLPLNHYTACISLRWRPSRGNTPLETNSDVTG